MINVIIFTDMNSNLDQVRRGLTKIKEFDTCGSGGMKPAGAYKIANVLRQHGYPTKVISHFEYYLEKYTDDIINLIRDHKSTLKIVAFSTTFMRFYKNDKLRLILEMCRRLNIRIVLGGPNRSTDHIIDEWGYDYYRIIGYAENAILKFLNEEKPSKYYAWDTKGLGYDFHNSGVTYATEDIVAPGETLYLELSRGCRFKCKFCNFNLLGRKPEEKYIKHPDRIKEELLHNYENWGVQNYYILCDTFNETTEKLQTIKDVIDELPFDIRFCCYLRVELINKNPEQISILRDMGIHGATFGVESLHHASSRAIGKGLHPDKTLEVIQRCKDSWGDNAILHGTFIIGLPHDTATTIREWGTYLMSGHTALDAIGLKELIINSAQKYVGDEYLSMFDKEPEKYGYEYDSVTEKWKNESTGLDSEKAIKIRSLLEKGHDTFKMSPWSYLDMLGYGFKPDEINQLRKFTPKYQDKMYEFKKLVYEKLEKERLHYFKR